MASDHQYEYVMERTPGTKYVTGEEARQLFVSKYRTEALRKSAEGTDCFDIDLDGYHAAMVGISSDLGFRYERVRKNGE